MPDQVSAIANAIKEGLSLWKTFIATRQEAYNRKMDQKKARAIDNAEKFILTSEDTSMDVKKKTKLLNIYRTAFFKYNN